MERRTWSIIGAAVVALGIGLVALGQVEADANVRFVEDVLDRPGEHATGAYTLLGRPQPAEMPVTGPDGTRMVPNPAHTDETRHVTAWSRDGTTYHSTHITRATSGDGEVRWSYRNETRIPGGPVLDVQTHEWTTPGIAFTVEAFDDGDGHQPRVWARYDGVLPQPLQPKPSQFTGRLATTAGDVALPPGAVVWDVSSIVAQCSSKFLPPEEQANA